MVSWFNDGTTQWGDFSALDTGGRRGDPTTTRTLMDGRFAFASSGPNRQMYDWARIDFPGLSLNGLSDGRGDHAELDSLAGGWYEDGMDVPWIGKPAFQAGVVATEEANRDNIVEVGK